MFITYLIVPAITDQAGQCRIASINHHRPVTNALKTYRENPSYWTEAGIMSSQGKLMCLDNAEHFKDMQQDEPLAAGATYTYEVPQ